MNSTLVILAGGIGARMGTPKALLEMEGKPILHWLLDRISWEGPTMLVTSPAVPDPPEFGRFDQYVVDPENGLGPLRGILTALENLATSTMVVIPVDMPNVRREQLEWVLKSLEERPGIEGVMCRPKSASHIEPFPSAFRAGARELIRRQLNNGQRSVHQLCRELSFEAIDVPENWPATTWVNLNDPDALKAFQSSRLLQSKGMP